MFTLASAVATAALSAAGCDGGSGTTGGGGTDGTACFDYASFDGTKPTVSFKTDVLPLFQRSCGVGGTSCHGDSAAPMMKQPYLGPKLPTMATDMDIMTIRLGIVDVPSQQSSFDIVASGKPEESFLMYKMDVDLTCGKLDCEADKSCGSGMPLGSAKEPKDTRLAQDERDTIRRWIAQGALDN